LLTKRIFRQTEKEKVLMIKKERLDSLVQRLVPHLSRNQIQSFIMQGKVLVEGEVVTKSGQLFSIDAAVILIDDTPKYVCRAGFKLEKALEDFEFDVQGLVALDAGLSTGGFTDCLLQNGAAKVFGIDVGRAQVHHNIKQDSRVQVMEQTNLRYVTSVGQLVDLVTLDLSFISVLKVMDAVKAVLKPDGHLIVLIKPQFEAARHEVGRGGIIKDDAVHQQVVAQVIRGITLHGFEHKKCIDSPILGATGNKEFLAFFKRIPL
jgi:23S rRNA (cytidine1920-2'-O)/16S rRNA (cytidine1409-2'-O)-methyltransferase